MDKYEKISTWFRIAANPKGIKEGLAHHWRCFIDPTNEVLTMSEFSVVGEATALNFIPQSDDSEGVDPRAWILMYGDVKIADGKGVFLLKNP